MPVTCAVLRFAKISQNAIIPTKGSTLAAGYDLYSAYDCVVPSRGKACVKTDIQIALPDGCYGRIAPRSGLAAKHFIDVGAGVVDQDYRGNVSVLLFNFGDTDFEVKKGDRIAQLICERIYLPELKQCEMKAAKSIKEDYIEGNCAPQRKKQKSAKFEDVEEATAKWFNVTCIAHSILSIDCDIIIKKAKEFAHKKSFCGQLCCTRCMLHGVRELLSPLKPEGGFQDYIKLRDPRKHRGPFGLELQFVKLYWRAWMTQRGVKEVLGQLEQTDIVEEIDEYLLTPF